MKAARINCTFTKAVKSDVRMHHPRDPMTRVARLRRRILPVKLETFADTRAVSPATSALPGSGACSKRIAEVREMMRRQGSSATYSEAEKRWSGQTCVDNAFSPSFEVTLRHSQSCEGQRTADSPRQMLMLQKRPAMSTPWAGDHC